MTTPTPRTDAVYLEHRYWANEDEATEAIEDLRDLARKLERELAAERETSRLLRVAMDARDEGYTQSRRRMSALESEVTAKGQAVRNLAEVITGQDKELATEREKVRLLVEINEFVGAAQLKAEREKVRVLRDACDRICDEWGRNHDTNPIGAGQGMSTRAGKALEATEDVA